MKKEITAAIIVIIGISLILNYSYALPEAPTETHPANSMWIEPSVIDIKGVSVGYKFNVTVWVNVTIDCAGWQFAMVYDSSLLNATGAGYTGSDGSRSQFFEQSGVTNFPVTPTLDGPYNDTHKYVLHGEIWSPVIPNNPYATGVGSLAWVEFKVIAEPPFTTKLDINVTYPSKTYVSDPEQTKIPLNIYNASVVPEFPSSWILILLLTISFLIAVLTTKKKK